MIARRIERFRRYPGRLAGASAAWLLAMSGAIAAEGAADVEDTGARYQITYNWQWHPAFAAAYSGPGSLTADADKMYTFSATADWGFRPWPGGEVYFDPELAQGVPFGGNLVGLGGFTNGEITRAGGSNPSLYRQRLFLRQTWNRGGGTETVDADFNRMAGRVDKHRVVLTVGNFSTLDVFDDNAYAKDPRTQFMNWSHWTYAAYDYAADARGFGWGGTLEWYRDDWAVRYGRMSGPRQPNMLPVDLALARHYGDQCEIEHAHGLAGRPGKIRLLAWRNRAVTASFKDALAWLDAHPGRYDTPAALFAVRHGEKIKYGFGINVEQALDENAGLFLRAMKADGRTETYAFTEVDGSFSTGAVVKGAPWGRAGDTVGIAVGINTLSGDRRRFLQAGGTSFFIGDGGLRYRPETNFESYYSLSVGKGLWVTANWQRLRNPAYNADRGPVNVLALRVHAEF